MAENHSRVMDDDEAKTAVRKLLAYCQINDWAGYDPYDALNSRILTAVPFLRTKLPRLVFTQALKRRPVNIRPLLPIQQTQNPKAIALSLSAFLNLSQLARIDQESLQQDAR